MSTDKMLPSDDAATGACPQTLPALTEARSAPIARPAERFSREQQALFLQYLAEWGNVQAAARVAGVSRQHAYRVRRACPDFARLWDAARLAAVPRVEDVLADRALNGVEEAVYYHGEEVAVRRRYDARLLLAHLERLDRLTQRREVRESAQWFEVELKEFEALPEIERVHVPVEDDAQGAEEPDVGPCGGGPFSD